MTKRCPTCRRETSETGESSSGGFSLHATLTGLSMEFPTARRLPWRAFFGILLLIGIWQTIAAFICTHLLQMSAAATDSIRQLIAGAFFFFGCCGAYQRSLAKRTTSLDVKESCPDCGRAFTHK
ncbi:hypothetical protein [Azotosporobacter soli]|uniref:hypothetical protein n=1 Tax=Azotosporobacter soli TaxID=3055040 RepID=UPI0031FEFEC0